MSLEKRPIFLLEGLSAVMLALPLDVSNDIVQLRLTYGEGAIAILPSEGAPSKRIVESKTRPAFQ
jgi:hypothetical protein